ncbi:hypothetical protein L484_008113 [Morus notabilis]|uniref:Uncharacterized protein n=1 Tax=Morus notabilis TaxID=981085 RepID=W9R185_9ROSA|nr:hypothetical protein L484_008113 [Morus notabilis]
MKKNENVIEMNYRAVLRGIAKPPLLNLSQDFLNKTPVICQKLLHKEHPSCCSSSYLKCWRHDLKAAKVESFRHIEVERILHLPQLETWSLLDP